MKIFQFRVIIDDVEGVFRDIEISSKATLLDLHKTILDTYGFSGMEMASFYMSDEDWERGEEISMMDMMEDPDQHPVKSMADTLVGEKFLEVGDRMLYLYDFLKMWNFYVEFTAVNEKDKNVKYPRTILAEGDAPDEDTKEEAGDMKVEFDASKGPADFDEELGEDGFEPFDESKHY
jgi:hypothetical protein